MNIHPLIVHFPIALLTTYSVLELLRFGFITRQPYWFYVKALMLFFGTLASYPAIVAGLLAKGLIQDRNILMVVDKHQFFGITTAVIFTIISLIYARSWMQGQTRPLRKTLILAVAGLATVFITGALGGSLVYGPSNDPVTNWIYNLIINN